jgi:predicted transposase YbfD/YdcC
MRAKEAPVHIRANWPGISWIIEMISTTVTRRDKQVPRSQYFLTSLRQKPEALLGLIRQRWCIQNEWHWPRDTQLHEDAHRYANRNGAPLFAFLRTVVMNLLRNGGYRSVHAGQQELSHNMRRMFALGGVAASTG